MGRSWPCWSQKAGGGISRGDVADLFRGDVPGLDVREFCAQMVRELKEAGLQPASRVV